MRTFEEGDDQAREQRPPVGMYDSTCLMAMEAPEGSFAGGQKLYCREDRHEEQNSRRGVYRYSSFPLEPSLGRQVVSMVERHGGIQWGRICSYCMASSVVYWKQMDRRECGGGKVVVSERELVERLPISKSTPLSTAIACRAKRDHRFAF